MYTHNLQFTLLAFKINPLFCRQATMDWFTENLMSGCAYSFFWFHRVISISEIVTQSSLYCASPLPSSFLSLSLYALPASLTAPAEVEKRLLDCYELGGVIGNGGFGSVYSGTSRATGDTVRSPCIQSCKTLAIYMCLASSVLLVKAFCF